MNQQAPEQWIRTPKQPPAHVLYAHKLGRGALTFEQLDELVKAINPAYVQQKQSKAYLSQHQARAEMNRIFGYGNWDARVDSMQLAYEERLTDNTDPRWPKERGGGARTSSSGAYWFVGYEGAVTVSVRDLWGMPLAEHREYHFEENAPQPNRGEARALALTSVESYALRRALINFGDRLGLGLYNGGSQAPHGQYTIQLQGGVLFDWQPASGAQSTQQGVPQAITHETIQAEPVRADDNTVPEQPEGAAAQPAGGLSPQMQGFHQAQQRQQEARDQVRQQGGYPPPSGGDMSSRLQQGFKVDEHPAGPTAAEEAQANG